MEDPVNQVSVDSSGEQQLRSVRLSVSEEEEREKPGAFFEQGFEKRCSCWGYPVGPTPHPCDSDQLFVKKGFV